MTSESLELLAAGTPSAQELPAFIERLNICAFNIQQTIRELEDDAARHEEEATAAASEESNATKRNARKAELLRDNQEYHALRSLIRQERGDLVRLEERSHRLAREFRYIVAQQYAQVI